MSSIKKCNILDTFVILIICVLNYTTHSNGFKIQITIVSLVDHAAGSSAFAVVYEFNLFEGLVNTIKCIPFVKMFTYDLVSLLKYCQKVWKQLNILLYHLQHSLNQ